MYFRLQDLKKESLSIKQHNDDYIIHHLELEKDYLELSGFEVEVENEGMTGLARALAEDFDLFILDLMLPGIDGFEICKQIREKKNTPILMVSAKKDDIDKIRDWGLVQMII